MGLVPAVKPDGPASCQFAGLSFLLFDFPLMFYSSRH